MKRSEEAQEAAAAAAEEEEQPATKKQSKEDDGDEDPFSGMRLSSHAPLESAGGRTQCALCRRRRKFFCYDCRVPLTPGVPRVALPLRADIVRHTAESLAKSTSVHGAILAPDSVRVVDFDPTTSLASTESALPAYDAATTLLLYPSETSVGLRDLPPAQLAAVERVVLVDSQWQRARQVLRAPALQGLRTVHLTGGARTAFWRYQSFGPEHLSTVEALYHFEREFHEARTGRAYAGEFDDLLWYFSHQYRLIQRYYREHPNLTFFHIDGFIK